MKVIKITGCRTNCPHASGYWPGKRPGQPGMAAAYCGYHHDENGCFDMQIEHLPAKGIHKKCPLKGR